MEEVYFTLERLKPLLAESGYMCLGHGTGRSGNSMDVVKSIFETGLRTKDNSLYFTSVGLSTPTPELIEQSKELGTEEPTIERLKRTLDNWEHQESKKIIIARIPTEYINSLGDSCDRDGEMYGAFFTEREVAGKVTYYLDPKFILGCYDAEKESVVLNKNYELLLTQETIEQLKKGYKKALEKTRRRVDSPTLPFGANASQEEIEPQETLIYSYGLGDFNFDDDIVWEDTGVKQR